MMEKKALQWHPAFYACLQLMAETEPCRLQMQNEFNLGTKPKQIDALITKEDARARIEDGIGRLFRSHNLVEYKGPSDNLSCNDFYKVCGYACFYIGDAKRVLEINPDEVTLTFVCSRYPKKLIKHLGMRYGIRAEQIEKGIYYLKGSRFPTQIIVSRKLDSKKYLWLYALRDDLCAGEIKAVFKEYEKHRESLEYQSVMDIIIRANWDKMKEAEMCEALKELYEEIYAEKIEAEFAERERIGEKRGERRGVRRGEDIMGSLIRVLLETNRVEDLQKAAVDNGFRRKLMKELGIPGR